MTELDKQYVKEWKEKYMNVNKHMRIVDIGSRDVNGNVRDLFEGHDYTGIDTMAGNNVDFVGDAHDFEQSGKFGDELTDLVICLNTLEHDKHFMHTLEHIAEALKPGGYFICSTPTFGFPEHRHPKDFYRFGADAYKEVIFNPDWYELLEINEFCTKKDDKGKGINPVIIAIGRKLDQNHDHIQRVHRQPPTYRA